MDVITGKDIPKNFKFQTSDIKFEPLKIGFYSNTDTANSVKLWGFDLVRPDQEFNIHLYLEFFCRTIENIWSQNKLPIVVGGTGMYLKFLINSPQTLGIPVDKKLRAKLQNQTPNQLFEILLKKDATKAKQMTDSDRQNPRRLIRALEVCLNKNSISNVSPKLKNFIKKQKTIKTLNIGLTSKNKNYLYQRIDNRVEQRINRHMVDELNFLLDKNYLPHIPSVTLGYQQLIKAMGNQISITEAIQQWKFAEHSYARNQMTWFKKQSSSHNPTLKSKEHIHNFDIISPNFKTQIHKLVAEWYS